MRLPWGVFQGNYDARFRSSSMVVCIELDGLPLSGSEVDGSDADDRMS